VHVNPPPHLHPYTPHAHKHGSHTHTHTHTHTQVKALKAKHGYKAVVMVGDGATDMQARPPAEAFIGYGGVAVRDAVRKGADWYVYDFKDMIEVVKAGAVPRQ
jgi:soluble P-type ATPase